jgi:hypothetical protein
MVLPSGRAQWANCLASPPEAGPFGDGAPTDDDIADAMAATGAGGAPGSEAAAFAWSAGGLSDVV